jgi:putative ABC transport system substrate-binding protein
MPRLFLTTLLVGFGIYWSSLAGAEQAGPPVVGFMSSRAQRDSIGLVAGFRIGLSEAGFVEAESVVVDYRWAEGHYDRLAAIATDLVQRGIAVLVATGGEPSALAAKAATSSIPIVFTTGGDPVKIGLVASLNQPGGNATGVSLLTTTLEAKRLELLHELVPRAKVVGVLVDPEAEAQIREVEAAAQSIGVQIHFAKARNSEQLELALADIVHSQASALLVTGDPFFDTRSERIIAFAAQRRMPAIYQFREYTAQGGLMSYGINLAEGYRQVGVYAGKILKGAKPSDLPVVQSVRFEVRPQRQDCNRNRAPGPAFDPGSCGRDHRMMFIAPGDFRNIRR